MLCQWRPVHTERIHVSRVTIVLQLIISFVVVAILRASWRQRDTENADAAYVGKCKKKRKNANADALGVNSTSHNKGTHPKVFLCSAYRGFWMGRLILISKLERSWSLFHTGQGFLRGFVALCLLRWPMRIASVLTSMLTAYLTRTQP